MPVLTYRALSVVAGTRPQYDLPSLPQARDLSHESTPPGASWLVAAVGSSCGAVWSEAAFPSIW